VHLDELPIAITWTSRLPEGFAVAARFPSEMVLRVTRRGDRLRQARLLSPNYTVEGVALVPLGAGCHGSVAVSRPPPASTTVGAAVELAVLVTNAGDRTFPGFGFVPRHLVHTRSCFARADAPPCRGLPVPLGVDVPAGASVYAPITGLVAPEEAGDYVLRVTFEQLGDGALDGCGLRPLTFPLRVAP